MNRPATSKPHVTIVGGGVSGLAAAFYLQKISAERGIPIPYTLLESSSRLGGKIRTSLKDRFVLEGAADSFITQKPWGLQLCRDLGLENELIPCNKEQQKVYVVHRGALVPLPAGFRLAAPTKWTPILQTPLLSLRGKLRVLAERWIPPRRESADESVAEFLRRRIGREAAEGFAGCIMAGIHVGDPEKLSLRAAYPAFFDMEREYGSLLRGFAANRSTKKGLPPAQFMSFTTGMSSLVERLESSLTGEIRRGERVISLQQERGRYKVRTEGGAAAVRESDAVILALPAAGAADLLAPLDEGAASELRAIRFASSAILWLGYDEADANASHPLDGYGFVVPRGEGREILACTWSSTKLPGRAPSGRILLRVFMGGDGSESIVDQDDASLVDTATVELSGLMGIQSEPVLKEVVRWRKANPQYDVGHLDRLSRIESRLQSLPGMYLAGCAYYGIGIPDCIKSGMDAAAAVQTQLAR